MRSPAMSQHTTLMTTLSEVYTDRALDVFWTWSSSSRYPRHTVNAFTSTNSSSPDTARLRICPISRPRSWSSPGYPSTPVIVDGLPSTKLVSFGPDQDQLPVGSDGDQPGDPTGMRWSWTARHVVSDVSRATSGSRFSDRRSPRPTTPAHDVPGGLMEVRMGLAPLSTSGLRRRNA